MATIRRQENQWVVEMSPELDRLIEQEKKWTHHSIYKLPARITDLNPNAYKPRVVSFGPYHHGETNLIPMEDHKQRALKRFIKRSGESFHLQVPDADAFVKGLKATYDSLDKKWEEDSDAFMSLMIRDGCFMLEVMQHHCEGSRGETSSYPENDPIFGKNGGSMMPHIKRDMLMLENQLPMSLLIKLLPFGCPSVKEGLNECINKLIIKFCGRDDHGRQLEECKHVLDVYRKSLLWDPKPANKMVYKMMYKPGSDVTPPGGDQTVDQLPPATRLHEGDQTIAQLPPATGLGHGDQTIDQLPPATRLHEAGITIRKGKTENLKDVSFSKGVLTLPPIMVDGTTEPVFLNLIAYEMFHLGTGNEVTSYVALMDDIIDSDKDVQILRHKEVISVNAVGCDETLANLFNSLSKDVPLDLYSNNHINRVRRNAAAYTRKPGNRWLGNLRHTYFKNPWTTLSLMAAIVLLGLTIVQTIFTIGQYYQGQNDSNNTTATATTNKLFSHYLGN